MSARQFATVRAALIGAIQKVSTLYIDISTRVVPARKRSSSLR